MLLNILRFIGGLAYATFTALALVLALMFISSEVCAQDSNFYFNDDVSGERTTLVFDGDYYTWTIDVFSVGYEIVSIGTYDIDENGDILLVPKRKGHTKLLLRQPNGSYLYTDGGKVQRLSHH